MKIDFSKDFSIQKDFGNYVIQRFMKSKVPAYYSDCWDLLIPVCKKVVETGEAAWDMVVNEVPLSMFLENNRELVFKYIVACIINLGLVPEIIPEIIP